MKKSLQPLPLERLQTYPFRKRKSLVEWKNFARPLRAPASLKQFLDSLPDLLAAKNFKEIVGRMQRARRQGRPLLLGMGAHPIKVGLNPWIVHLMNEGMVQGVAMNGAGIIHDFEIAFAGKTSEDVTAEISGGTFGMARETGQLINEAINEGWRKGWGIGRSVGEMIQERSLPHREKSITAAGVRLGIPVTVHVALGTDIIHLHPQARGEAIGGASHKDFRLFAALVSRLQGGVYLNLGSAVILPEVFLKALTLVRNLGHRVTRFTTVDMDFISHYRPLTNVVRRPTLEGGKGFHLTGHHEIMFPLLAAALLEELHHQGSSPQKSKIRNPKFATIYK